MPEPVGPLHALVTGGAGFIGSHLAGRLREEGWRVTVVDALTDYYPVALKQERVDRLRAAGAQVIVADLCDLDLTALLSDVDDVYHLAGQPGVRASWGTHFPMYTRHNIAATQLLLEAARATPGLRRFVYSSSSSIYGDAESFPTREDALPAPVSPYGVTKLAAEHLCALYGTEYGVPTVSLRYFTVYGPGQRPDMAFTRFLTAAHEGSPIEIFGDGEQRRDFTYVSDVVAANLAAGASAVAPGSVFNVAGGSSASVNEVLELVREIGGRPLDVRYTARTAGDARVTGADTTAITAELGWAPVVDLREGIARQAAWVAESRG